MNDWYTRNQPVYITLDSKRQNVAGYVVALAHMDPEEYEVKCRFGTYFVSRRQLHPRELGDISKDII